MNDLLSRLRRFKLILTSLILTVSGIALIAYQRRLDGQIDTNGVVHSVPWSELGGILFGAGLLNIWVDSFFRREHEAMNDQRMRQMFADQAPLMRDAVLRAFAANTEDLARVATPETLDQVVTNSLALRFGDRQFAEEIFRDIHDQAIEARERWHDASIDITVSPMEGKHADDYFAVTVRWEYTTIPSYAQRQFVCLSDRRQYAELTHVQSETSAWFLKPNDAFDASQREAFELLKFSVHGEERKIRRSSRKGFQSYTAEVGSDVIDAGKPVGIAYTYRTVTKRSGHLLFFDIEAPTRDLKVSFDHTSADLAHVSVIDMVPSVRRTRIEQPAKGANDKTLRAEVDGWIFPRSGIAFVWTVRFSRSEH